MRKFVATILCASLMFSSFAQRNTQAERAAAARAADREDMLRQSKRSRTAAIIMVSAGSTIAATGVVMMAVGAAGGIDYNSGYNSDESLVTAGAIVGVAGLGLALGSIPVFIKSHR